jgi:hypothetical protein
MLKNKLSNIAALWQLKSFTRAMKIMILNLKTLKEIGTVILNHLSLEVELNESICSEEILPNLKLIEALKIRHKSRHRKKMKHLLKEQTGKQIHLQY